jgi:hypothetical protein
MTCDGSCEVLWSCPKARPPGQIDDLLVLYAGFLFKTAITTGPSADRYLLDMMVALATASLRWLHERW